MDHSFRFSHLYTHSIAFPHQHRILWVNTFIIRLFSSIVIKQIVELWFYCPLIQFELSMNTAVREWEWDWECWMFHWRYLARIYARIYAHIFMELPWQRHAKPRNDFRIARNKSFSLRIFMYRCACFWLNQLWFERSLLHTCHLINTRKNDSVSVSVWTLPKSAKRFWTYQWAFVRTLFPNVQSNIQSKYYGMIIINRNTHAGNLFSVHIHPPNRFGL